MINIAVADDEILFRQGLISLLEKEEDFKVLWQASDGAEVMEFMKSSDVHPDVIILDLRMKPVNGIDTAKILKNEYSQIKIIILTSFYQPSYLSCMVKIGVNSFLPKNCPLAELVKAIRTVNQKGLYFSDEVIAGLREAINKKIKLPTIFDAHVHLTPREHEILQLICKEYSTPEIADQLCLSVRTVEGHRNNLLIKIGAKNTVGLVIYALTEKLIDMDEKIAHLSLGQ